MYTVSLQFGQAWVLDIFCGNSRDVQICPATTTILDILVVLRVLRLQHHQLLKHPSAILLEIFQHVLKWRPTHTAEILSGEEKTRRLKFVTLCPVQKLLLLFSLQPYSNTLDLLSRPYHCTESLTGMSKSQTPCCNLTELHFEHFE